MKKKNLQIITNQLKNMVTTSQLYFWGRSKLFYELGKIRRFNDDVFLVSYPKSGNTWLRFLISNYLTDNQGDLSDIQEIVPDIHRPINLNSINQLQRPRFIKSHKPFSQQFGVDLSANYPKVIYLVRDARDVAVSEYFYCQKLGKISLDTTFKDFVRQNFGNIFSFDIWSNHVNFWLDNAPSKFLLIKYEEMHDNTLEKLIDVLEFAGIHVDKNKAIVAVEASKFEKMKAATQKAQNLSEDLKPIARTGKVGDWQNFFDDELMSEFIEIYGSTLKRLGYI